MKRSLLLILILVLVLANSCASPAQPTNQSPVNSPGLEPTIENKADGPNAWHDLDQAVEFFKQITAQRIGQDMADVEFSPQYYNESNWSLVENNGNRLVATYKVAGGQLEYREFIRGEGVSEIIYYDVRHDYPEVILMRWQVRNEDLATIEVARDIPFEEFTQEYAIKYLKDMFFWGDEVQTNKADLLSNGESKQYLIGGVPDSAHARQLDDKSGWWYVFDNGSIVEAAK